MILDPMAKRKAVDDESVNEQTPAGKARRLDTPAALGHSEAASKEPKARASAPQGAGRGAPSARRPRASRPARSYSPLALPQAPMIFPTPRPDHLVGITTTEQASTTPAQGPAPSRPSTLAPATYSPQTAAPAPTPVPAAAPVRSAARQARTSPASERQHGPSPQSRHPPLPSPAPRAALPTDDTLEPGDEAVLEATLAFHTLRSLASLPYVLMADLNSAQDRLHPFLTHEGLHAAPARADRFCRLVVDMHNNLFGALSIPDLHRDLHRDLRLARERLDALWALGRRATQKPQWIGRGRQGHAVV